MGMPDFASVDDYLAAQPADIARVLRAVRATIRAAIPQAEETVSYKIPTYKIGGTAVIFFAAWKQHWSLYPASDLVTTTLARELTPYEVQKGTIKLPYTAPPAALVARIAKLRAQEVLAKQKAKKAAPKKKAPKKAKAAKKKKTRRLS